MHRFVQDKIKISARANPSLTPLTSLGKDDTSMKALRLKMHSVTNGRKATISNNMRFEYVENPWKDYGLTLQTLKKERHEQWLEKKKEK